MTSAHIERDAPAFRAAVLAECLKQAALVPGPFTAGAHFLATLAALRVREEDAGHEIRMAMNMLVSAGLLDRNRYDRAHGGIAFAHRTTFAASKELVAFLRDESEYATWSCRHGMQPAWLAPSSR